MEKVHPGWTPHISDPGYAAWLIVALYAFAAAQSWRAARAASAPETGFWIILTLVFVALCVNKQLDLQTLLTQIGRDAARAQGWYKQRRAFQLGFIVTFATITLIGATAMLIRFRRSPFGLWLAAAGLSMQALFVVMRAASMHHADAFFRIRIGGFRLLVLLELPGIIAVIIAAGLYIRQRRVKPDTRRLIVTE